MKDKKISRDRKSTEQVELLNDWSVNSMLLGACFLIISTYSLYIYPQVFWYTSLSTLGSISLMFFRTGTVLRNKPRTWHRTIYICGLRVKSSRSFPIHNLERVALRKVHFDYSPSKFESPVGFVFFPPIPQLTPFPRNSYGSPNSDFWQIELHTKVTTNASTTSRCPPVLTTKIFKKASIVAWRLSVCLNIPLEEEDCRAETRRLYPTDQKNILPSTSDISPTVYYPRSRHEGVYFIPFFRGDTWGIRTVIVAEVIYTCLVLLPVLLILSQGSLLLFLICLGWSFWRFRSNMRIAKMSHCTAETSPARGNPQIALTAASLRFSGINSALPEIDLGEIILAEIRQSQEKCDFLIFPYYDYRGYNLSDSCLTSIGNAKATLVITTISDRHFIELGNLKPSFHKFYMAFKSCIPFGDLAENSKLPETFQLGRAIYQDPSKPAGE